MNCKNCNTELLENDDYCRSCGGRVIRNRLTIRNLFEHLSETFFNYDNKLLRTIVDLFRKPDEVIVGYIDGVRKKYVNPVSLFGLALTITGLYMIVINKFFPEMIDFSYMAVEGQEEFQRRNMQLVQEYQSLIVMLYVPIYALMARLVFFDKKRFNITELLVVFMYIQAHISIISAAITIAIGIIGYSSGTISMFILPLMILYTAYALKRIYKLSFFDIIVRTLLFLVVLAISLVIFTVLLFAFMYFTGDLQEMIEAQKAAEEAAKSGG
ncbi:DUF3667 domain-containing protein [Winogradskyella sp. A2]|uniref:DUF3667 domain-containing protein n=1 Tax=Winogradskyella sp. A2 TaxID=3366944 RepID=UPI00398C7D54